MNDAVGKVDACQETTGVVELGQVSIAIRALLEDAKHVSGQLHAAIQANKRLIARLQDQLNHQGN